MGGENMLPKNVAAKLQWIIFLVQLQQLQTLQCTLQHSVFFFPCVSWLLGVQHSPNQSWMMLDVRPPKDSPFYVPIIYNRVSRLNHHVYCLKLFKTSCWLVKSSW